MDKNCIFLALVLVFAEIEIEPKQQHFLRVDSIWVQNLVSDDTQILLFTNSGVL